MPEIDDRNPSGGLAGVSEWGADPPQFEGLVEFTCDTCRWYGICLYSYDWYNTNGDCLASM